MPPLSARAPRHRLSVRSPGFAACIACLAALLGCATPRPPGLPSSAAQPTAQAAPAAVPQPMAPVPPAAAASSAGTAAATVPRAALAPGAAASAPPAAPQPPGTPPPFAVVVRDATRLGGLLTLWRKDDKVWLELGPQDFGKLFFLSPKLAGGIGESGLIGGLMASRSNNFGRPQIVEFRRQHNVVQLLARNAEFVARDGTPAARSVRAGFSPSLLASVPVASSPHPQRGTILVEANGLFISDMLGIGISLQRAYRQSYGFDARNSSFTSVRAKPDLLVFEASNHYATGSIAQPAPASQGPAPSVPRTLPDARSMFIDVHYSLARLPDEPMRPRLADPRIGYFPTTVQDYSDDLARTPKMRWISRWRLEKKDPGAAVSEPVRPIAYWLDRSVPEKYRQAVTAGILEWNKAFERIGFKEAIVVKVQPEDADFDTLDFGVASVRWMTNASPTFGAIGPSHVDPRSGEILDADIGFESLSSRSMRALRAQVLAGRAGTDWQALMQVPLADRVPAHAESAAHDNCSYADAAAEQLSYALDVLEARGELDPASPQAQQFVLDYIKDTTMHEVGHTLGLRHNFRASKAYSERQLADESFTREHSTAASVMEYAPINLPRPGERGGTTFQATLGPYDYWAIEYGYKPIDPADEAAELARIAARSSDPLLAYGTDEDNYLGIDPDSLVFDLGDDALAFAKKRIEIARDLIARQEQRLLNPDASYAVLRRSLSYALRDVGRASGILARQIGGVRTLRDYPGSGRDPLQPASPAMQRAALETLAGGVLAADSFKLSSALARRLAPDFDERAEAFWTGEGPVATDFTLESMVGDMQRALLGTLMAESLAARILDSAGKVDRPSQALRLSELYERLSREVWSELGRGVDIPPLRRDLQRDHVNRVANLLLRPGTFSRADARSLLRVEAQRLLAKVRAARNSAELSAEARAHLADCADTLAQALQARLVRAGT